MMDDQVLALVLNRLDRLEAKVDRLMSFRAWVLGAAAGIGALASVAVEWLKK